MNAKARGGMQPTPTQDEVTTMDVEDVDEALVEQVLEETLKGFDKLVGEADLQMMRELIRGDLLHSPEGQRRLRQARPEPHVERSGDVPVDGARTASQPTKKAGKAG